MISSNTTIDRAGLKTTAKEVEAIGAGGLSGKPVYQKSNDLLKKIGSHHPKFPVIAVGGIRRGEHAQEKIGLGAQLIQVYTGFVFEGPGMIKKIKKHLASSSQ